MTRIAPQAAAPQATPAPQNGTTRGQGAPKKDKYPIPEGGLMEIPQDYDPKKHANLKEDDFHDTKKDLYFDFQAEKLEARAANFRGQAESFRRTGSFADRKTASKIVKMRMEYERLMAKLVAEEGEEKVKELLQD